MAWPVNLGRRTRFSEAGEILVRGPHVAGRYRLDTVRSEMVEKLEKKRGGSASP